MQTITTPADFALWLEHGKSRTCIYHIGNLAEACEGSAVPSPISKPVRNLANAVWIAAVERKVYLLQKKRKGEPMAYLAVRPQLGKVPRSFAPCDRLKGAA